MRPAILGLVIGLAVFAEPEAQDFRSSSAPEFRARAAAVLPVPASAHAGPQARGDAALDPFLAGAVGLLPFASGLYLSDRPARGVVFSLIDGLLALGIYTAAHTRSGDPDNVKFYLGLMGVNNALDAYLSAREALRPRKLAARVTMRPDAGVEYSVRWKF